MVAGLEIDFLPVGEASKSGDAIVVRYGSDTFSEIAIVDGGNLASGDYAVEHIKSHFGEIVTIAHVICTHQDNDHSSGLRRILENFVVENLWVHQPWLYAEYLLPHFKHNWSVEGLKEHLRYECFPTVSSLCDLAEDLGIPLREPFAGIGIGPFTVLAPTQERLLDLIPQMDQTPVTKQATNIFAEAARVVKQAVLGTLEGWGVETLGTPGAKDTSIANETSVVLFAQCDAGRALLTADAGIGALQEAMDVATYLGLPINAPNLIQMPHHGSRRNVSPGILDQILGGWVQDESAFRGYAVGSVAKGADGFPRKVVENAFTRRGYRCSSTKGEWINWNVGLTKRPNMGSISFSPLHTFVESY